MTWAEAETQLACLAEQEAGTPHGASAQALQGYCTPLAAVGIAPPTLIEPDYADGEHGSIEMTHALFEQEWTISLADDGIATVHAVYTGHTSPATVSQALRAFFDAMKGGDQ